MALGLGMFAISIASHAIESQTTASMEANENSGQKEVLEVKQDSRSETPNSKPPVNASESQSIQSPVETGKGPSNSEEEIPTGKIITEKIPNKDILDGHEKLLKDIHILMGLGVNQSFYRNDSQESVTELGPSFKADVIYLINQDWAVEWSGIAAFKEFSDILVWDTLLTLGVRKVMGPSYFFNGTWFTRYYLGYGHSVAYVDRDALSELGYSGDINRIHFGGEVVGLGAGMVWESENKSLHFFELNWGIHYLKNREAVNIQNDVPVVVANDVVTDNSRAYHIHLTYGVLLF